MFDLKVFTDKQKLEDLKENLKIRNFKDFHLLDEIGVYVKERNEILQNLNSLQEQRNAASKSVASKKSDTNFEEVSKKVAKDVKQISLKIKELELKLREKEDEINLINLTLPNQVDKRVPVGKDEKDNVVCREVGEKTVFDFTPLSHYDLGIKTGWINFEKGAKLAGARFYTYFDEGAKLERALINFMLDMHTKQNHYKEVWVPVLINDESMVTTGQYPKFKDEYFRIDKDKLNLIPTSEVPLVNLYRDEILDEKNLPIYLTSQTSCFRREAGSYGKETRGLLRVHQFQKVELVKITNQETSEEEHKAMVADVENLLKQLELPYRVVLLCGGDMSAASSITYDIEVWMPSLNNYFEISSISNIKEYQARRGKIRYKTKDKKKKFVHTLNGSALAIGRTVAAIMENYQTKEGKVTIPNVLRNYF